MRIAHLAHRIAFGLCGGLLFIGWNCPCATVFLAPVADTTLSENYPSNNLGGLTFFNAGTTQNFTTNRALLRFDVSGLPTDVVILSANLVLEVTGEPNEPGAFSDFGLFRVLRSWTEGTKVSPTNCVSCRGQGSVATVGEATWFFRHAFTSDTWASPAGAPGTDYVGLPSATTTIYGVGDSPYTFSSGALASDVQGWCDDPGSNHGLMLICLTESAKFTARRFGSREDEVNAPRLVLDYVCRPTITSIRKGSEGFVISFTAIEGDTYDLLSATDFSSGEWSVARSLQASGPLVTVTVPSEGRLIRFFRVEAR